MADDVMLGVHSNVRKGQTDPETGQPYGFDAGHAWISVTRDGTTTTYGLWPDAHPRAEDNGSGSDVRQGMEDGDTPAASRYFKLSPEQAQKLDAQLKDSATWGYTNNCSSWARDTVEAATGVRLNADDPGALWTETPRQLGESIHQLEQERRTGPEQPAEPAPAKGSSSQDPRADLSDTSRQLLQDSEQQVRGIADRHGLAWDAGMDNTVAAVARQAREDGLTGITHMKAADGEIRFAQADGYQVREGRVDAREAANTPEPASLSGLAQADARQPAEPEVASQAPPQMEMAALQRA